MGLTRSQIDAQLAELYAQIPRVPDCDGRCWTSCGPIAMSDREGQRIRAAGTRITRYDKALASVERFWCDALTGDKRCAVYELRPMVCRLWGAVESMPCVYGCKPEGRYLTDAEGYRLLAESWRIGGGDARLADGAAGIDAAMAREETRAAIEEIRARGRAGDLRRTGEHVPAAFRRTVRTRPLPGERAS